MSLQRNDAFIDAFILRFSGFKHTSPSVCKEDFSTSLEMTIREYRYPHHHPEPANLNHEPANLNHEPNTKTSLSK